MFMARTTLTYTRTLTLKLHTRTHLNYTHTHVLIANGAIIDELAATRSSMCNVRINLGPILNGATDGTCPMPLCDHI